jgi:ribosomal-protein-alanine N-acetyltransferase
MIKGVSTLMYFSGDSYLHIGKNIELKPLSDEDFPFLHEWFNQPDFMGDFFNTWCMSMDDVKGMLNFPKNSKWWKIIDWASNKPAGIICSIPPYTMESYFGTEIGYIVHQDNRGKGLATQASCMLINHLFDSTQLERIIATIVVGNEASCKVVEKAGMSLEGVERRKFFLHGRFVDTRLYSIIRDDWVDELTYRSHHPF